MQITPFTAANHVGHQRPRQDDERAHHKTPKRRFNQRKTKFIRMPTISAYGTIV